MIFKAETVPTAIDLFAGAGGATQGLKEAGYVVLAAVENDPSASSTYEANHPEVELFREDVRRVSPRHMRQKINLEPGGLSLLKACPPCQGYSKLGKGDPGDERNDLVVNTWDFIREFRPRALILENVPRLASDGRLLHLVRQSRAIGYKARIYMVDAANFGVPQRRRRLILLAAITDSPLPDRLEEALPVHFDRRKRTAGEVLRSVEPITTSSDPIHVARKSSDVVLRRIRAIPIGGTRFDLPNELRLQCHARLKGRNATSTYSRVQIDQLAPTLTTRCTTPSCGAFIHPTEDRGLSLREAALLQGFPRNYIFDPQGRYGDIERQIGNAVPVRMAQGLGLIISNLLFGLSESDSKPRTSLPIGPRRPSMRPT